jgi:hypothetical protein
MQFSAKWDPIPSMLCQNHTQLVKGFMGQTTSFDSLIKSNVLIMGMNLMGSTLYSWPKKECLPFTEGMIQKTFSIRWGSANSLGFTP